MCPSVMNSPRCVGSVSQGKEDYARSSWWALSKQGSCSPFGLGDLPGLCLCLLKWALDRHKLENTASLLLEADVCLLIGGRKQGLLIANTWFPVND